MPHNKTDKIPSTVDESLAIIQEIIGYKLSKDALDIVKKAIKECLDPEHIKYESKIGAYDNLADHLYDVCEKLEIRYAISRNKIDYEAAKALCDATDAIDPF